MAGYNGGRERRKHPSSPAFVLNFPSLLVLGFSCFYKTTWELIKVDIIYAESPESRLYMKGQFYGHLQDPSSVLLLIQVSSGSIYNCKTHKYTVYVQNRNVNLLANLIINCHKTERIFINDRYFISSNINVKYSVLL